MTGDREFERIAGTGGADRADRFRLTDTLRNLREARRLAERDGEDLVIDGPLKRCRVDVERKIDIACGRLDERLDRPHVSRKALAIEAETGTWEPGRELIDQSGFVGMLADDDRHQAAVAPGHEEGCDRALSEGILDAAHRGL